MKEEQKKLQEAKAKASGKGPMGMIKQLYSNKIVKYGVVDKVQFSKVHKVHLHVFVSFENLFFYHRWRRHEEIWQKVINNLCYY